ncbi:single-stranded DNA-binding protein [Lactobacillus sp. ESL0679]|uniref:single-stranded DNA-binding protein n=1 Tax=Lactobacillus sp. ESL0679 TaxID=2983209 RepID=UPI0023F6D806|nr:single-stranded DNA-binding protein [Lactobacillus sp. ESL0679]MDF7683385.1 single-stranded DNA-binding protein [Lactobacillus sp. ESL0679]
MINRTVLVGRLTRDPELRTTRSGANVLSFTLAVDRNFKNQDGSRDADFIQCVAWKKTAEIISQYSHKGSMLGVDGRIQTRNYDDKNGQRVYVAEVIADQIALLNSKNSNQGQQGGYTPNNNGNGVNNQSGGRDPFAGSGDTVDISDDDLPF